MKLATALLLPALLFASLQNGTAQRSPVARFYSPDSKIVVAHHDDFNFTDDFTIEMWIFVSSHAGRYNTVIEKLDDVYGLYVLDDGRLNASVATASNFADVTSTDKIKIHFWHHIAFTYDAGGGILRLYVDGKYQGLSFVNPPEPITPSAKAVIIGGATFTGSPFYGYMDEIRISKFVRYRTEFDPKTALIPDVNTVGLYRFDEGSGNTTVDWSGKGHDATLTEIQWIDLPITGMAAGTDPPSAPLLGQNYPNPFSRNTSFTVRLDPSESATAVLRVYDVMGRFVADLSHAIRDGQETIELRNDLFPGEGIYYYTLQTGAGSFTRRMMRVR